MVGINREMSLVKNFFSSETCYDMGRGPFLMLPYVDSRFGHILPTF